MKNYPCATRIQESKTGQYIVIVREGVRIRNA